MIGEQTAPRNSAIAAATNRTVRGARGAPIQVAVAVISRPQIVAGTTEAIARPTTCAPRTCCGVAGANLETTLVIAARIVDPQFVLVCDQPRRRGKDCRIRIKSN